MTNEPGSSEPPRAQPTALASQIGGWRGVIESALPTVVFVIADQVASLRVAIWTAALCGVAVFLYRLLRRESPQQALGGLFALAVAVLFAARMGESRGFFLPGILFSVAYGLGFAISALARWPVIGVIWSLLDGSGTGWRDQPRLRRGFSQATWLWVGLFAARASVQGVLYVWDSSFWLGVSRVVMGLPLTAAAIGATLVIVQRARRAQALEEKPGGEQQADGQRAATPGTASESNHTGPSERARD